MSIIGPRPQLVRDMVFMTDEQRKRHGVRPGLLEYFGNPKRIYEAEKDELETMGRMTRRQIESIENNRSLDRAESILESCFKQEIWVVTDSQILLLVTQHTSIIEQISFLSFFTLPFPLLGFIKEIMPGKHRVLSVMRKLFVFTLALYLINYISGCDLMIIILICEHLLMTVTLLRVIWNGINGNKKHKNLKLQRVINGCVAYCVFSIISLLQWDMSGQMQRKRICRS